MPVEEFLSHIHRVSDYKAGLPTDEYAASPTRLGNGYIRNRMFDDLTGNKFGKLTVSQRLCAINGHSFYSCKCDCGSKIDLFGFQLKHTKINSCGCAGKKHCCPEFTVEKVQNSIFGLAKLSSKRRSLSFSLSFPEFISLCEQPCHYCGLPPDRLIQIDKHGNGWVHGGIDRKDSSMGYVPGNVVPCCETCNVMKAELTTELEIGQTFIDIQKAGWL